MSPSVDELVPFFMCGSFSIVKTVYLQHSSGEGRRPQCNRHFDKIPFPFHLPTSSKSAGRIFMKYDSGKLLFAVDLAGTLLFGIEGATAAIAGHLDLLGLLVLAFSTALAGGIIRDLLIGAVPPSSLRDWRYSAVAFTGAAIVFFLHRFVQGIPGAVIVVLDAAGLALFAVAGTEKALLYKMHPFIAILLGTSPGLGEARSATSCWLRFRWYFAPTSMQPRPWQGRRE